ncbi:Uncharacterised protein [Streptococcus pneumoniae]|nr:Uncharacterised protein [Streptococcus pneumoniae]
MCFTHSFFHFATLRKSLQTTSALSATSKLSFEHLAVYMLLTSSVQLPYIWLLTDMITDFVSFIYNLCQFYLQPQNSGFDPEASFLVCSLILIEY